MQENETTRHLQQHIQDLESRLEESEQLIDAIKAGEVDAFAIRNEHTSEVFTLQSGDYAYRLLIEEIDEGALNVTEDGLIVYTNPYFCHLLRLPYEKVIGHSITEFIDSSSLLVFQELFNTSLTKKSKGEINFFSDNTTIPVYISLTSLQPRLATTSILVTDFTEKKKTDQLILKYQAELEIKNNELSQSNVELASFAYVASHDLQEPLRKIQTFVSRILLREMENLSEDGISSFKRLQNAAAKMQTLINDLLEYSRVNNNSHEFIDTDISTILEEVYNDLKEEIEQKNAVLETKRMCKALVIPFQFRQLLFNLLGNALKFSDPSRRPHIVLQSKIVNGEQLEIYGLSKHQDYCHITISDNGIGFDPEYNKKIFELFQRLHGNAEYNGTGIGLSIVKKIVENHHGVIIANGEPGKGATFDIYIPTS